MKDAAIELVIFDCDGVLIDSELIGCAADAEVLTEAGFPISSEEMIRRFAGVPAAATYAAVEAQFGRPLPADLRARARERIFAKYRSELQAMPGAYELLSGLPARACVASSSTPSKLALGLVETDLFELLYPHIYSAALVERGKPFPDIFLYAASRMEAEPAACLVVEDSVAGVTAGRAAGMRCIGFVGGSHCSPDQAERLREAGAEQVIGDLRELLRVVG